MKYLYCPKCDTERDYVVKLEKETYPVRGEQTEINAQVSYCTQCGEQIWNEEIDTNNLKEAFRKYRANHGLLQSEEIKHIREKYALSQTAFARVLGFGDKTVTRYENGSIQDLAQNNLMMLSEYPDVFKVLLLKNKDYITENEFVRASEKLSELMVRIVCNEAISYHTVNNPYTYNTEHKYYGGLANAR